MMMTVRLLHRRCRLNRRLKNLLNILKLALNLDLSPSNLPDLAPESQEYKRLFFDGDSFVSKLRYVVVISGLMNCERLVTPSSIVLKYLGFLTLLAGMAFGNIHAVVDVEDE